MKIHSFKNSNPGAIVERTLPQTEGTFGEQVTSISVASVPEDGLGTCVPLPEAAIGCSD